MILIVDDDEPTRKMLLYLLKVLARTGQAVSSGQEALAFLRGHREVGCVILDYRMPEMSGLDVLRAIREDPQLRHINVLMYSAEDGPIEQRCLEAGANAFIQKCSLDWLSLRRAIDTYCGEGDGTKHDPLPGSDLITRRSAG